MNGIPGASISRNPSAHHSFFTPAPAPVANGHPSGPGQLGPHALVPGAGASNLGALFQAGPRMDPPAGWPASSPIFDDEWGERAVRIARRYSPERAWSPRHWRHTVGTGAWAYLNGFGAASLIGTAGTAAGHPIAVPIGVVIGGMLTKLSEHGLANYRVGAIPNENPGKGLRKWLRNRLTEDLPLTVFLFWYGAHEALTAHLDQSLAGQALGDVYLDPGVHPWAVLVLKLVLGSMAGVCVAIGSQALRQRMGAEMKVVAPAQRKTAFRDALRKLGGNPLTNSHLLQAVGRGLALVPIATLIGQGAFDRFEPGWPHGLAMTLGLLAFWITRSDVSDLLVKGGAVADRLIRRHNRR